MLLASSMFMGDRKDYVQYCVAVIHKNNNFKLFSKFIVSFCYTQRKPGPAQQCFDSSYRTNPLKTVTRYSVEACLAECKVGYMVEECGCRLFNSPSEHEGLHNTFFTIFINP